MTVLYIMARVVALLLTLLEVAMLLRAIFSWIPAVDESAIGDFIYMITEPVIAPIRAIFDRFSWFQNSPIDISFLIGYIVISAFQAVFEYLAGVLF